MIYLLKKDVKALIPTISTVLMCHASRCSHEK